MYSDYTYIALLNVYDSVPIDYHGMELEDTLREVNPDYDALLTRIENNSKLIQDSLKILYEKRKDKCKSYYDISHEYDKVCQKYTENITTLNEINEELKSTKKIEYKKLKALKIKQQKIINSVNLCKDKKKTLSTKMAEISHTTTESEKDLVDTINKAMTETYIDMEIKHSVYDKNYF